MPLVVPGIMNKPKDSQQEWLTKLMGKKISDTYDENSFAKKDLPEAHRVVKDGDFTTQDMKPDRLNIHVGEDERVRHVNFG